MLISPNNETEALLLSQTSPVGVELFSYFKAPFYRNKNWNSCWQREAKRSNPKLSWILNLNVDSISVKLGFQIPIVSGIPDSKAQDFWFQKEEFPVFPWNPGYLACLGRYRLQNSPYSCVFKYARVVKQKVWNEAEKRERDWGETLFSRRACDASALRVCKTLTLRFIDLLTDFEKKTRLFCSLGAVW